MRSYLVYAMCSELIDAENEDEAIDKMYERISNRLIKRYEWEFSVEENDFADE